MTIIEQARIMPHARARKKASRNDKCRSGLRLHDGQVCDRDAIDIRMAIRAENIEKR